MKRAVAGTVVVTMIAVAVGTGYWFGARNAATPGATASGSVSGAPPAKSDASAPIVVEAEKVTVAAWPQTLTAVGSLRSDESVTLRPEVAGRVASIGFQEGQRVAKGALLVQLDPAVPQAEVQQARANLVLAKTKFDR